MTLTWVANSLLTYIHTHGSASGVRRNLHIHRPWRWRWRCVALRCVALRCVALCGVLLLLHWLQPCVCVCDQTNQPTSQHTHSECEWRLDRPRTIHPSISDTTTRSWSESLTHSLTHSLSPSPSVSQSVNVVATCVARIQATRDRVLDYRLYSINHLL